MKLKLLVCSILSVVMATCVMAGTAFADKAAHTPLVASSPSSAIGGQVVKGSAGKPVPLVDISRAKVVLPQKKYRFTGSPCKPLPQVKLGGKRLVPKRDYTVHYKKNKRVGAAMVVVRGVAAGGYRGKACATFGIVPGKAKLERVESRAGACLSALVRKVPGAKNYQFLCGKNEKMTKDRRIALTNKRSCVFTGLEQGERYYVKVRVCAKVNGRTVWGEWSNVRSITVKWKPVWLESEGYYTYRKDNGTFARGLTTINNKEYLFDSLGHQKLGWQYYRGEFRYFAIGNKQDGYLVKDAIVNGIYLDKDGVAQVTEAGGQELSIMCKAQQLVEALTVPTQSKWDKLISGFYYLKDQCVESLTRNFYYYDGWHREMALDVFDYGTGSCFSYGAALTYYANALGYGQCIIVSSGGHGWAEIDGEVYDAEWSRHCGRDLIAVSYDESGAGIPAYASARIYTVQIAPNTGLW